MRSGPLSERRQAPPWPALDSYFPPCTVTSRIVRPPPWPRWLKKRLPGFPAPSIVSAAAPGPYSSTSCNVIAPEVTDILLHASDERSIPSPSTAFPAAARRLPTPASLQLLTCHRTPPACRCG